jgi:hypothetical protein
MVDRGRSPRRLLIEKETFRRGLLFARSKLPSRQGNLKGTALFSVLYYFVARLLRFAMPSTEVRGFTWARAGVTRSDAAKDARHKKRQAAKE